MYYKTCILFFSIVIIGTGCSDSVNTTNDIAKSTINLKGNNNVPEVKSGGISQLMVQPDTISVLNEDIESADVIKMKSDLPYSETTLYADDLYKDIIEKYNLDLRFDSEIVNVNGYKVYKITVVDDVEVDVYNIESLVLQKTIKRVPRILTLDYYPLR